MTKEQPKQRKTFKDWYDANKEALLERRAARYKNDPAYREAAKDRAARQRAARKDKSPDPLTKVLGGEKVVVFRIGNVSAQIGRAEATIRLWEEKGLIPKPIIEGKHRYYTEKQVALIDAISGAIGLERFNNPSVSAAVQRASATAHANWRG